MTSAAHNIEHELTEDEIVARLAALENAANDDVVQGSYGDDDPDDEHVLQHYGIDMGAVRSAVDEHEDHGPVESYRFFDPLPNAADEYIKFAQSPEKRVYLGIPEFDDAMRGIAPGELLLVVGFAHSGKTLLTAEVLLANRDRRVCFFTPDETRVLVLVKLCSLVHGISAEELEARIAVDDVDAIEMVRSTAREHFPNLAVFDQGVSLRDMTRCVEEATHHWGGRGPELVIFDYLELLDGYDEVKSACNGIKSWGKNQQVPLMLLHQSSRTAGADGKSVTISSGGFGGEQQATFLIGVRRKKSEIMARILDLKEKIATSQKDTAPLEDKKAEAEYELRQHENTVTFNLVKNKRPPSRLVEEIDFELDQKCGRITPLAKGDLVHSIARRTSTAADRARQAAQRPQQFQRDIYGGEHYVDEEPF